MDEWGQLENEIIEAVTAVNDEAELEMLRVAEMGKKGRVSELLKKLGGMSQEERHIKGPILNGMRDRLKKIISERQAELKQYAMQERIAKEYIDVTLPVRCGPLSDGRIHPVSHVIEEVSEIFACMGFSIVEGNDIETDYYNFSALNFPEGHPAREMHDTFFLHPGKTGEKLLLRTHTSPVQIHTMEIQKPPLRIIAPGRTYRRDSDQTHTPMFHQLEGLVIDKTSHLGHMKWVLEEFCKAFFEVEKIGMRFRPSFFPFTEPSLEVDINCSREGGRIILGKGDDWLEILGCGMVHPNVLKNCGIDPNNYQGFAWGVGIDRIAMLKYGMTDLRSFFDADIRWLKHYGFRPFDFSALVKGTGS